MNKNSIETGKLPVAQPEVSEILFSCREAVDFHEAYVATKALAAYAVHQFDAAPGNRSKHWQNDLMEATQTVIDEGGLELFSDIQKEIKIHTVDGKLLESLFILATDSQKNFLGHSLRHFAQQTAHRVDANSTIGADAQAFARRFEGRYALEMLETLETNFILTPLPETYRPFGFIEVLKN